MPTYDDAVRTKRFFEKMLFSDYPQIVSVAPQVTDKGEGYICIGVEKPGQESEQVALTPLPTELPMVDIHGILDGKEVVEVMVEDDGEILSPKLGIEITKPLTQLRQRHAELIDKKFLEGLNSDEQTELEQIELTLDRTETSFYEPAKYALRRERDRLVARQAKDKGIS